LSLGRVALQRPGRSARRPAYQAGREDAGLRAMAPAFPKCRNAGVRQSPGMPTARADTVYQDGLNLNVTCRRGPRMRALVVVAPFSVCYIADGVCRILNRMLAYAQIQPWPLLT
jgi:hypothetical protein